MLSAPLHNSVSGLEKGVSSFGVALASQLERQLGSLQVRIYLRSKNISVAQCPCDAMCELFAAADWRRFPRTCVDLKMQSSVELDSSVLSCSRVPLWVQFRFRFQFHVQVFGYFIGHGKEVTHKLATRVAITCALYVISRRVLPFLFLSFRLSTVKYGSLFFLVEKQYRRQKTGQDGITLGDWGTHHMVPVGRPRVHSQSPLAVRFVLWRWRRKLKIDIHVPVLNYSNETVDCSPACGRWVQMSPGIIDIYVI